jgi:hypothetical protein
MGVPARIPKKREIVTWWAGKKFYKPTYINVYVVKSRGKKCAMVCNLSPAVWIGSAGRKMGEITKKMI